ncbi:hypothetical protein ES703_102345 [subsurface metagenome]
MDRCCNDVFGYCTDPSNIKTGIAKLLVFDVGGGTHEIDQLWPTCDLDPETCNHCQTLSESAENLLPMTSKG